MEKMQRIGERIRAARLMAGMSQQQVADELGVSKMAVSKWEHGKVNLTSRHLLNLGCVLDRKVEYFLRPHTVKIVPATYSPHCSNRRWLKPPKQLTPVAADRKSSGG